MRFGVRAEIRQGLMASKSFTMPLVGLYNPINTLLGIPPAAKRHGNYRVRLVPSDTKLSDTSHAHRTAVAHDGPSVFYVALRLLSRAPNATQLQIDMFDRLWALHSQSRSIWRRPQLIAMYLSLAKWSDRAWKRWARLGGERYFQ